MAEAFAGQVSADLSNLTSAENAVERRQWSRLLEMYLPVRRSGSDEIIAVIKFYQLPDAIDGEVGQARLVSWGLMAAAIGASCLLLFGIVKQGSDTISRQDSKLRRQVGELSTLLAQNSALNNRVNAAAQRTLTLNERAMRRISADLHDGPGQTLALALMRLDAVKAADDRDETPPAELEEIEAALQDALRDMRAIAAGLRMPELADLSVREVVGRAVCRITSDGPESRSRRPPSVFLKRWGCRSRSRSTGRSRSSCRMRSATGRASTSSCGWKPPMGTSRWRSRTMALGST